MPCLRPADLPHRRVELFEVGVPQISKPDVAEAGLEVELDVVGVRDPGRRPEPQLPGEPFVEVAAEGHAAVALDVGALVDAVEHGRHRGLGVPAGVEWPYSDLAALAVSTPGCVIPEPPCPVAATADLGTARS